VHNEEAKILCQLHADNEHEMEMGKMATERSNDQTVIAYGQRLIEDH
jgi:predicted outer membrane protein